MFRAWVFVLRSRSESPEATAGEAIRHLWNDNDKDVRDENRRSVRRVIDVYGEYDCVVQLECESLERIHWYVVQISQLNQVQATTTYVSAKLGMEVVRDAPASDSGTSHQAIARLQVEHGSQDRVLQQLLGQKPYGDPKQGPIANIDGADIVFGDYDIVVVLNESPVTRSSALRLMVERAKDIKRTATLIPYPTPQGDNQSLTYQATTPPKD